LFGAKKKNKATEGGLVFQTLGGGGERLARTRTKAGAFFSRSSGGGAQCGTPPRARAPPAFFGQRQRRGRQRASARSLRVLPAAAVGAKGNRRRLFTLGVARARTHTRAQKAVNAKKETHKYMYIYYFGVWLLYKWLNEASAS
jgi:hypothetical protein